MTNSKYNQLNFLRFFAAFLVFYGHQYIFIGKEAPLLFGHPIHKIGLDIFFIISGYLISMSWERNSNIIIYFKNRALRIFPALIITILLTVFIFGPILTTYSLEDYFSNENTWIYLKNIFLYISYYLPGVFEHNIVPNAVNGSLWSLPVEFLMYILVAVLGIIFKVKMKFVSLFLWILLIYFTLTWAIKTDDFIVIYNMDLKSIIYTSVYFWGGATLYHFRLYRYFKFENFVLGIIILGLLHPYKDIYELSLLMLLPFLVMFFGMSTTNKLGFFNKADYSYGIYIYAFPVQQLLVFLYPRSSIEFHIYIGFFIILLLSIISWHFIEKPSLKYK